MSERSELAPCNLYAGIVSSIMGRSMYLQLVLRSTERPRPAPKKALGMIANMKLVLRNLERVTWMHLRMCASN